MAIGDSSYYAGSLVERIILAEAFTAFNDANVVLPLVTAVGQNTADTITIPKWNLGTNTITSSDVGSHTLGSDATVKALDSDKVTLTLAPYSFYIPLYDEARDSSAEMDMNVTIAGVGANAVSSKVDSLLCALFSGLDNSVSDTSNAIDVDDLFSAVEQLQTDGTKGQLRGVFNPKQIWGTYGLSNTLVTANGFGGVTQKADEMLNNGFLGNIAGIDVYNTREAPAHGTGAVKSHYGAVFGDNALAFGYANPLIRVEPEREGKKLRSDIVFSMFAAAKELEGTYGAYILTKTSA